MQHTTPGKPGVFYFLDSERPTLDFYFWCQEIPLRSELIPRPHFLLLSGSFLPLSVRLIPYFCNFRLLE